MSFVILIIHSPVANFEIGGFLGNDSDINLPDTILPNDTTAFPWDFWSDTPVATHNWGVIDQQVHIDEAAAPNSIFAISPTITLVYATTTNRNELLDANQSTVNDPSRADPFVSLESVQESQTKANITKQTAGIPTQPRRLISLHYAKAFANC